MKCIGRDYRIKRQIFICDQRIQMFAHIFRIQFVMFCGRADRALALRGRLFHQTLQYGMRSGARRCFSGFGPARLAFDTLRIELGAISALYYCCTVTEAFGSVKWR